MKIARRFNGGKQTKKDHFLSAEGLRAAKRSAKTIRKDDYQAHASLRESMGHPALSLSKGTRTAKRSAKRNLLEVRSLGKWCEFQKQALIYISGVDVFRSFRNSSNCHSQIICGQLDCWKCCTVFHLDFSILFSLFLLPMHNCGTKVINIFHVLDYG